MNDKTIIAAMKIVAYVENAGAITDEEASDFLAGFKENRETVKDIKKLKAKIRNIKVSATTAITLWLLANWELVLEVIMGVIDAKM